MSCEHPCQGNDKHSECVEKVARGQLRDDEEGNSSPQALAPENRYHYNDVKNDGCGVDHND